MSYMPKVDNLSNFALEKLKVAIDGEILKRRKEKGGQNKFEFEVLHSDRSCEIETLFIGYTSSGFYDVDLVEAAAYVFKLRCKMHNSSSLPFAGMTWINGAVDVRDIKK